MFRFFVVSGYLINDLLRQEWAENQTIDLKGFYVRRMKRLYPALIVMLLSAVSYITLFQQDLLNNIRSVVASSIFITTTGGKFLKGFLILMDLRHNRHLYIFGHWQLKRKII